MRWMSVVLAALILVIPAWAEPGDGSRFSYDPAKAQLAQAMSQAQEPPPAEGTTPTPTPTPGKLIPGKALLLSAIIPGTGQFYAKSPIIGAAFMALEIGAWAGVAMFHKKGMDREDEYKIFADEHWTYWVEADSDVISPAFPGYVFGGYLEYEYYAAYWFGKDMEQITTTDNFLGTLEAWMELPWGPLPGDDDDRLDFLPRNGFTHELDPNDKDQQYYEMIGKYSQFGAGWPAESDNPVEDYTNYRTENHIKHEDGEFGRNWQWIASNNDREKYLNLRKESNDALDMSKNFTMAVLGNHLVSALHAGFAVSWHNKKMAKEQKIQGSLHFEPRKINNERVTMASLRVSF